MLILDGQLPGMSGLEICRFLRAQVDEVALPILMLTVQGNKVDIVEALSAHERAYAFVAATWMTGVDEEGNGTPVLVTAKRPPLSAAAVAAAAGRLGAAREASHDLRSRAPAPSALKITLRREAGKANYCARRSTVRNPIVDRQTLYIGISQSGETADTLSALREIKLRGGLVAGITVNVAIAASKA